MQNKNIKGNLIPLIKKLMALLLILYFGFLFSNTKTSETPVFYVSPNTVITNAEQIHISRGKFKVKKREKKLHFAPKKTKKNSVKKIKQPQPVFHFIVLTDSLGNKEREKNFVSVGSASTDRKKGVSVASFVVLYGVFIFLFFRFQNQRDSKGWFLLGFYKHIYRSRPPPTSFFY